MSKDRMTLTIMAALRVYQNEMRLNPEQMRIFWRDWTETLNTDPPNPSEIDQYCEALNFGRIVLHNAETEADYESTV
jgi:hypothetical protein